MNKHLALAAIASATLLLATPAQAQMVVTMAPATPATKASYPPLPDGLPYCRDIPKERWQTYGADRFRGACAVVCENCGPEIVEAFRQAEQMIADQIAASVAAGGEQVKP